MRGDRQHLRVVGRDEVAYLAPGPSLRVAKALRPSILAVDDSSASARRLVLVGAMLGEKMRSSKTAEAMRAWVEDHAAAMASGGDPYARMADLREAVIGVAEEVVASPDEEQILMERAVSYLVSKDQQQKSGVEKGLLVIGTTLAFTLVGGYFGKAPGAAIGCLLGYLLGVRQIRQTENLDFLRLEPRTMPIPSTRKALPSTSEVDGFSMLGTM